ncbi:MAG: hypothetical protein WKF96_05505 [Solirubrobacteraceae bacterium]
MWPELLDVLREPHSEARLDLDGAETDGERILRGHLVSRATGRAYPIIDGVRRFVPSEGYTGSFGMHWNTFSATQLDSTTRTDHSQRRFDAEVGWPAGDLGDGWTLEGGCGAGRFVEVVAGHGGRIVALDYSRAIDTIARESTKTATFIRCKRTCSCRRSRRARSIACTASGCCTHRGAGLAMMSLLRLRRSGGRFAFVAYARRWYTPLYAKYLIRPLTKRVPATVLLAAIRATMPVLLPLSEWLFKRPGVGRIARFVLPVANYPNKQGSTATSATRRPCWTRLTCSRRRTTNRCGRVWCARCSRSRRSRISTW